MDKRNDEDHCMNLMNQLTGTWQNKVALFGADEATLNVGPVEQNW